MPVRRLALFVDFGILLALVLVAFWPIATGERSFFHYDMKNEHLPIWEATSKAIRAGDSPFWLPGEFCGHPTAFGQDAPLFYPPTIPLLATGISPERLIGLFTLFHFWLAGVGAYLLLLDLGGSRAAALFAGIAWMLSARLLQSSIWPSAVAASALLPFLVLGWMRIGRGRSRSGMIAASLAGGLLLLAGRPQIVLGAAPLLAAVAVAAVRARRPGGRRRAAGEILLSVGFALAIGAPSILTVAALYPETSRGGGLERSARDLGALDSSMLRQVFLPVDGPPAWPESAAYPGVLVVLALAAGFLAARREPGDRRRLLLACVCGGVIGLVFAFGESGPYGLLAPLPLFRSFRTPARFLVSWSLGVAVASGIAVSWMLARLRRPGAIGATLVAVLAGDLVLHARSATPSAPFGTGSSPPPIADELRPLLAADETGAPRRYWPLGANRTVYVPDHAAAERLRRRDPLAGAYGMRFGLESVLGGGPTLVAPDKIFNRPTLRAVELGGVGALVAATRTKDEASSPFRVVPIHGSLPRAIVVPEAIVVRGDGAVVASLDPRLDPRRTAVLEEGEPLAAAPGAPAGRARFDSRRPGALALTAESPTPSVLVVFDAHERGWKATVDGNVVPVLRADGAFLGLRLSAGRHRVRFDYSPPLLFEGCGLALAGLLGLVLAARRLPEGTEAARMPAADAVGDERNAPHGG